MEGINVEMEDGFIVINDNMQTSIPNIYAIGDCTQNSSQLAHAASAQGLNAISHIVGEKPAMNIAVIPSCVYTSPEIATVGLMESDAAAKGIEVKTSKFLMAANGKSLVTEEERGYMKLVFDAKTEVLLGAHLMCARATDIISELTCAIVNKLTAHELASAIRPHPTYVEGISEAVEDIFGLAIHMAPKRKP
jgi:dihydrolipoamide dehydrogenase